MTLLVKRNGLYEVLDGSPSGLRIYNKSRVNCDVCDKQNGNMPGELTIPCTEQMSNEMITGQENKSGLGTSFLSLHAAAKRRTDVQCSLQNMAKASSSSKVFSNFREATMATITSCFEIPLLQFTSNA